MKILYGYPNYPAGNTYGNVEKLELAFVQRMKQAGFNIDGFCLTLDPPSNCLSFPELDRRWRRGDKKLLTLYENLENALEGKDVLLNSVGINLHPEFVEKLPVFTVYQCFDDIDGLNENLTVPILNSYDLYFTGNVAEVDSYKKAGIENVEWTPLGFYERNVIEGLTFESILESERDIDYFMMIDRLAPWNNRKVKLDALAASLPTQNFFGRGWKNGFLSNEKEKEYLKRAKIGPNIHLASGPLNYRTYYLPANGVMQVCDNKSFLGKIFELDKEVVGFDTIDECIELCRYYQSHDEERRIIAANGWKRAITDYNEVAVFKNKVKNIEKYYLPGKNKPLQEKISIVQMKHTKSRRFVFYLFSPFYLIIRMFLLFIRKLVKMILPIKYRELVRERNSVFLKYFRKNF